MLHNNVLISKTKKTIDTFPIMTQFITEAELLKQSAERPQLTKDGLYLPLKLSRGYQKETLGIYFSIYFFKHILGNIKFTAICLLIVLQLNLLLCSTPNWRT